jgi:diaminopimelate decarboxylase
VNDARRTRLLALAERLGTPAFVYFPDAMRARVAALRRAFGGAFAVAYAVKANPAAGVLAALRGVADALDVSSAGEIDRALAAGWPAASLGFTGPGKRPAELEHALDVGVGEIVLESLDEALALDALARARGVAQRVLLRLAPDHVPAGFGDTMSGKPVAFGVDEEELPRVVPRVRELRGLQLVGFHVYSGTQCLRADAIAANWAVHTRLFRTAAALARIEPERLVLGAGLGIPYHDDQQPLELAAVEHAAAATVAELRAAFPRARLSLETGRWIAGEAGVYLTRVLRTKDSRGTRIGICDGGLHHHLAACGLFGMVLRRNYRLANVSAPPGPPAGTFQLSGPLCTPIDVLARAVALPRLEPGDVIAIECSGAYGATASPVGFLSHPPPREWLVRGDGGSVDDVLDANALPE